MIPAALFAVALGSMPPGITTQLVAYVYQQADENGVPRDIAEALIRQESGWRIYARHLNPNGTVDMGLMQINNRTWMWLEKRYNRGVIEWPYDPYAQVRLAMKYLGALYTVFGSWGNALAAYNGGPAAVYDRPKAVVWYVRRVTEEARM